jgi:hypothetical protein
MAQPLDSGERKRGKATCETPLGIYEGGSSLGIFCGFTINNVVVKMSLKDSCFIPVYNGKAQLNLIILMTDVHELLSL